MYIRTYIDIIILNFNVSQCTILGDKPKASHSHCSAMWNNSLLMYGGLDEDEVPICSLYQISFLVRLHIFTVQL